MVAENGPRSPTPTPANPYTQTYVVKKGDTLSRIAEEFYGDARLYPKIFEANRDVLSRWAAAPIRRNPRLRP